MKKLVIAVHTVLISSLCLLSPLAVAQPLQIKPLAEKKVAELPAGSLFWRIENFTALDKAQAAAGPLSLVAESAGKV